MPFEGVVKQLEKNELRRLALDTGDAAVMVPKVTECMRNTLTIWS